MSISHRSPDCKSVPFRKLRYTLHVLLLNFSRNMLKPGWALVDDTPQLLVGGILFGTVTTHKFTCRIWPAGCTCVCIVRAVGTWGPVYLMYRLWEGNLCLEHLGTNYLWGALGQCLLALAAAVILNSSWFELPGLDPDNKDITECTECTECTEYTDHACIIFSFLFYYSLHTELLCFLASGNELKRREKRTPGFSNQLRMLNTAAWAWHPCAWNIASRIIVKTPSIVTTQKAIASPLPQNEGFWIRVALYCWSFRMSRCSDVAMYQKSDCTWYGVKTLYPSSSDLRNS